MTIKVSNLSFAYDYEMIFDNLSFTIDSSWRLGLIGNNGCGKTTLLKILDEKYDNFLYFPFKVKTNGTVDEVINKYIQLEEWEILIEFSKMNLDYDTLHKDFNVLSSGEQTKILLILLFLLPAEYYLIDEPTNHLDLETKKLIGSYLSTKSNFMIASHDRMLLDLCCDHIFYLTNQTIYNGNYSSFYENKLRNEIYEKTKYNRLKKEIDDLSVASRKTTSWANKIEATKYHTTSSGNKPDRGYIGMKSARMMKKAKNYEKQIEKNIKEKEALLSDYQETFEVSINQIPYFKNQLIHLDKFSILIHNKKLFNEVTISINSFDKVCIRGANGAGKSCLIKLLLEQENYQFIGSKYIGSRLAISYVSQNSSECCGSFRDYINKYSIDESKFRAILNKFDFKINHFDIPLNSLSEGMKRKVMIARSLASKSHLHIWDEPLNYLDIKTRIQIEDMLINSNISLIFVEHDEVFTTNVATKYLDLTKIH